MKHVIWILLLCTFQLNAQTIRIAVLDFENLSGNPKYDGLGKALSSMLISDIELNVSGKKMQLVERGQLNKILKEQNLQSGKSFDKNSTVKVGKLLGINFILVGDIYVLKDDIIINARLTSVENGEIKFSNKQEGKLIQWLAVKTKIAKDLSNNLKLPFMEPSMPDKDVNIGIITKYASAIEETDKGNLEKAAIIAETVKEINPDFAYSDDLIKEIDKIKKEISHLRNEVETSVIDPIKTGFLFIEKKDYDQAIKYFHIGLSRTGNAKYGDKYAYFNFLSNTYFKKGDFDKSIAYADSVLTINPFEQNAIKNKVASYIKSREVEKGIALFNEFYTNRKSIVSSNNPDYLYNSVYKFLNDHKDFKLNGLDVLSASGPGNGASTWSFYLKNATKYASAEDFDRKNEFMINKPIINIISNNYEFSQILNSDSLITFYTNVLYESGVKPLSISKLIDQINIVDTLNIFGSAKKLGLIKKSGDEYTINSNYVFATTGKNYTGPALYFEIDRALLNPRYFLYYNPKDLFYGMYAKTNEEKRDDELRLLHNGASDLVIPKYMYDIINSEKSTFEINNNSHAFQIYKSAWYKIRGGEYKSSIQMFKSVANYFYKLAALGKTGDDFTFNKDWEMFKLTLINLGHSYLLNGDLVNASKIYERADMDKNFKEVYNNLSREEVIKKDWDEFIANKLITPKEIDVFSKTFLKN